VAKKIVLPVLDELTRRERAATAPPKKKPSIDAARARLGGRAKEDAIVEGRATHAPGMIVRTPKAEIGVVVYASARETHVLFDGSRLRRLAPEDVELHEGEAPDELGRVAADARVFFLLVESQSVRYADDAGTLRDGKLVEKCRYGALVLRDDGAIVAVGFRKLWPAPRAADA
jgi:hypothetical protein